MEKKVYSVDGKELRTVTLDDDVFARDINEDVIYYAITNELANKRVGTACTKTRSEVHGSNAKPYKQKGTGHARRGDKKSPINVGGGTIFGPKPRDFSYAIPKKAKRLAMKSILRLQAQSDRLTVVEDFTVESGKTKDLAKILNNFAKGERTVVILDGVLNDANTKTPKVTKSVVANDGAKKNMKKNRVVVSEELVELNDADKKIKQNVELIRRAGKNLHNVSFLSFNHLRAHDLFYARRVIVLEAALQKLADFYKVEEEAK